MPPCDWLDRLTIREVENIKEREKRQSDSMYLMIEFPAVFDKNDETEFTVVYYEQVNSIHQLKI